VPSKKIEDEIEACNFNKIDNRKTRRICHQENLDNIKREKEIKSKNIPKDRRLDRIQIRERLKEKLAKRVVMEKGNINKDTSQSGLAYIIFSVH